jgi:hypothetical protein
VELGIQFETSHGYVLTISSQVGCRVHGHRNEEHHVKERLGTVTRQQQSTMDQD